MTSKKKRMNRISTDLKPNSKTKKNSTHSNPTLQNNKENKENSKI